MAVVLAGGRRLPLHPAGGLARRAARRQPRGTCRHRSRRLSGRRAQTSTRPRSIGRRRRLLQVADRGRQLVASSASVSDGPLSQRAERARASSVPSGAAVHRRVRDSGCSQRRLVHDGETFVLVVGASLEDRHDALAASSPSSSSSARVALVAVVAGRVPARGCGAAPRRGDAAAGRGGLERASRVSGCRCRRPATRSAGWARR